MASHVLAFKPAVDGYGVHDPSAAIFSDGELLYAVEEERLNRQKHATGCFPEQAIRACLDHCGIELSDVSRVVLPYRPELKLLQVVPDEYADTGRRYLDAAERGGLSNALQRVSEPKTGSKRLIRARLRDAFDGPIPPIEEHAHHACHAASAFHPSGFRDALVLTVDGRGEYDATVAWRGTADGLERVDTYPISNSLGHFFGAVTEYLGFRAFNGEGKVMGLAPYGERNEFIESRLREIIDTEPPYDVTGLVGDGSISDAVETLESLLERERADGEEFDDFDQDFAYVAQSLLEEAVTGLVRYYCRQLDTSRVALAGGVALNCKMNKRVMELDCVDDLFIQPVAHDGGLAVGAGMLEYAPADVPSMTSVYWGPEYSTADIESTLDANKIDYEKPADVERDVAERLADGQLVGWVQGRVEMGPRALGNRSILADPRTAESRDRVNEYVKHREGWRPFAPSMLEDAADRYLVDAEPSPYMIKTFDTDPERRDEIEAVLHPGDDTTRPQTVREDQNPRYHRLISEFEAITGVPVVLNTSFNDHGEPIVTSPSEAIRDFYGMGLDVLVLGDVVLTK